MYAFIFDNKSGLIYNYYYIVMIKFFYFYFCFIFKENLNVKTLVFDQYLNA